MNPLLPPYVRDPPPFDSMDLSLQSSRSASSPLNKSATPTQHVLHDYKQQSQQQVHSPANQQSQPQPQQQQQNAQQAQSHTPHNYAIHLPSSSPQAAAYTQSAQQQQPQQRPPEQYQTPAANLNPHEDPSPRSDVTGSSGDRSITTVKYSNSNGGDCDMLPPPLGVSIASDTRAASAGTGSIRSSSDGSVSVDNYMHDNEAHMQERYAKLVASINNENELQAKTMTKQPVELVNIMTSSNKLSSHPTTQLSPKKHSALINYRHTHAQQQQNQQQQQSQQHCNSARSHTHNGPHTPPTPISPVASQQKNQEQTSTAAAASPTTDLSVVTTATATGSSLLDYNQLHPQQHISRYAQRASAQVQQQQSVLSDRQRSPPPPPHHHNQQQCEQQRLQPSHQTHFGAQLQRQQQHLQQHQSSQLQHHHLLMPPMHQIKELDAMKSAQTDCLATATSTRSVAGAAAAAAAYLRTQATATLAAFAADNTSLPDNVNTSNEDSVDSNSNSSRTRRKCKPNKLARKSSIDSEMDEDRAAGSSSILCLAVAPVAIMQQHRINSVERDEMAATQLSAFGIDHKSPTKLETLPRRSPRKIEIKSPISQQSPKCVQSATPAALPPPALAVPVTLAADAAVATVAECAPFASVDSDSQSEKPSAVKNGGCTSVQQQQQHRPCSPRKHAKDTDFETIDKIAEMIAKTATAGESREINSSNSNSSGGLNVGSPKTKKQRQALKLRNVEHQNFNSNCSTNSNSYNSTLPVDGGAANDNAVLAEELHKEKNTALEGANLTTQTAVIAVPAAVTTTNAATHRLPSPLNCCRSCSSSSNSNSSSSNSSRSSCDSKVHKPKTPIELTTTITSKPFEAAQQKQQQQQQQEEIKIDESKADITKAIEKVDDDDGYPFSVVAAETCAKQALPKYEDSGVECRNSLESSTSVDKKGLLNSSPTKSCFEEVENKLEEMFAGIEDEPPAPAVVDENIFPPSNVTEVVNDLDLALELTTSTKATMPPLGSDPKVTVPSTAPASFPALPSSTTPSPSASAIVKVDKATPTKAAKKSTLPSPAPVTRKTPPRRRLSVMVAPRKEAEKRAVVTNVADVLEVGKGEEEPSTSVGAAAIAAPLKKATTSSPKKQCKSKNTQRSTSRLKPKATAADVGAADVGVTKGLKVDRRKQQIQQQQQQKKMKRKRPDSEDDEPTTTNARESNTVVIGSAGGASGGNQLSAGVTEAKYKSPYILVKRDGSINVINAPTAEDMGAEKKKQAKAKKAVIGQHRGYAHDRKNLRGMHYSTLSNKYDADTADKTWICVFCKHGPHRLGLGDLFGPYLISTDCEEYRVATKQPGALDLDAVMLNKRRRLDMVQSHPRNLPVVPAGGGPPASTSTRFPGTINKKKKKSTDEPPSLNISLYKDAAVPELEHIIGNGVGRISDTIYEVWLHEDCAVWAPAVFLVGARVMGLDAAVWNSTRHTCVICCKTGAMVCCLKRECHDAAHIPCARQSAWSLDEQEFKVFCHLHKQYKHNTITSSSVTTTITTASITTTANATKSLTTASSALAELLNRPPPQPTNSNLQSRRYS